jgi:hypothetical protein
MEKIISACLLIFKTTKNELTSICFNSGRFVFGKGFGRTSPKHLKEGYVFVYVSNGSPQSLSRLAGTSTLMI